MRENFSIGYSHHQVIQFKKKFTPVTVNRSTDIDVANEAEVVTLSDVVGLPKKI